MLKYDARLDVPARAIINGELLSLLETGGTFFEAKKALFTSERYSEQLSQHVYSYRMTDQSFALSLLYCSIVVPREFLDLPADHQLFKELDAVAATESFVCSPKMESYTFLRCLRNSVAHALYSIEERNSEPYYTFWTERTPKLDSAVIGQRKLLEFVANVGRRLANAVLAEKSIKPESPGPKVDE
ncbi:hypothetical protein SH661x_001118 [Planctomicrobium sp. SH661]|uniref:hypothetical protein n=1 Tax=Planctomicrobium sp. SH661 TaxID=3448124 RepID=UPI003F5AFCB8